MELRVIRTEVRQRGYWADTKALTHPKMIAIILMLTAMGHVIAPGKIDWIIFALGLLGMTFVVLGSYRVNELHDGTTATAIPKSHHIGIAIAMFVAATAVAVILAYLVGWWVLGLYGFGAVLTILYNADVHPWIHNRPVYGAIWGGCPLVFSEMVQAGSLIPSLGVILLGGWATVVAVYTLWLWGPTTCGRLAVCKRAKGTPSDRLCHSPVLKCRDRLVMPKEVHNHMKVLTNLNLSAIGLILLGVWFL